MPLRKRLSPEESRRAALEAARTLLIEAGPHAVTLKAVAGLIDRTHANLLHHFGSAAGLQKALAEHLAASVCGSITDKVRATRAGMGTPREVVDLVFDAFDREGGAALVTWMILSGNEDALDPVVRAIHQLIDDLHEPEQPGHRGELQQLTLKLVLLALGDALIGDRLVGSLHLARGAARERAEAMVAEAFAQGLGYQAPNKA